MEMDLDTRQHGDTSRMHDEPVDYDLDIDISNDNEPTWTNEDIEIQEASDESPGSEADANVQMVETEEVELPEPSDAMDTLETGTTFDVARSDADMLSNIDPDEHAGTGQQTERAEMPIDVEAVAAEESVPAPHAVSGEDTADAEYLDLSDAHDDEVGEISYEELEVEGAPVVEEAPGQARPETEGAADVEHPEELAAKETGDDNDELTWKEDGEAAEQTVVPNDAAEVAKAATKSSSTETEHDTQDAQPQEVNHQDDGQANYGEVRQDELANFGEDEVPEPGHQDHQSEVETMPEPEATQNQPAATATQQHPEATDAEGGEVEADEVQPHEAKADEVQFHDAEVDEMQPHEAEANEVEARETNVHETEQGNPDDSAESQEAFTDDTHWPSITVQYKGEEFPCFAPADGFFADPHVVEGSIENVLAGLRAELAAELTEDEELVFHVDELGLEFAESTQRELLSTTTLRSILDLYEMLVQNQDHDAEVKPLYTYLFTRSSPSKRLDYLMDSAANGRGLDEIIHLFEPAMTHSHETEHEGDSDSFDYEHDEHQSHPDGLRAQDGETLAHAADGTLHDSTDVDQAAVSVGLSDGAEDGDQYAVEAGAGEEHHVVEGAVVIDQVEEHAGDVSEGEAPTAHDGEEDDVQHEAEQPEVTETADLVDHTAPEDVSDAYHEHVPESENVSANPAGVETSATSSTLDGAEAAADDLTYEDHTHAAAEDDALTYDDELAEIDWKDEEDEGAPPVTEQSPSGKRTRADEELDETEENETKRQRSS